MRIIQEYCTRRNKVFVLELNHVILFDNINNLIISGGGGESTVVNKSESHGEIKRKKCLEAGTRLLSSCYIGRVRTGLVLGYNCTTADHVCSQYSHDSQKQFCLSESILIAVVHFIYQED